MILANLPFMPEQASTIADQIDAIYLFTVALSTVVSLLIVAAIIGFIVKFRRKRADQLLELIALDGQGRQKRADVELVKMIQIHAAYMLSKPLDPTNVRLFGGH